MSAKERERVWIGGAAAGAVVMALLGYFVFIEPQRSELHTVNSQIADATAQNSVISHRISNLIVQNRDLAKFQATLAQDRLALPSTSGLPDFLRTLQSIGALTHTDTSLTVGAPTDVTTVAGASTAAAPGDMTINGAHIYALPITAQVTGAVSDLDSFLTQLQAVQPRAVLVGQITETAGVSGSGAGASGTSSLSLTMQAFVAPSDKGEAASLAAAAAQK